MSDLPRSEDLSTAEDEASVWDFSQDVQNTEAGSTVCSSALQERRKAFVGDERSLARLSKENERSEPSLVVLLDRC